MTGPVLRQLRDLEKGNPLTATMNDVAAQQVAKRGNRYDV